jgi:hypothetical protein
MPQSKRPELRSLQKQHRLLQKRRPLLMLRCKLQKQRRTQRELPRLRKLQQMLQVGELGSHWS